MLLRLLIFFELCNDLDLLIKIFLDLIYILFF